MWSSCTIRRWRVRVESRAPHGAPETNDEPDAARRLPRGRSAPWLARIRAAGGDCRRSRVRPASWRRDARRTGRTRRLSLRVAVWAAPRIGEATDGRGDPHRRSRAWRDRRRDGAAHWGATLGDGPRDPRQRARKVLEGGMRPTRRTVATHGVAACTAHRDPAPPVDPGPPERARRVHGRGGPGRGGEPPRRGGARLGGGAEAVW